MKNKIKTLGTDIFSKKHDFNGKCSDMLQYFIVEFEVFSHGSNGKRKNIDVYKLYITREADKYICKRLLFQHNDKHEVSIPSLAGWSYSFDAKSLNKEGIDEQGLMLGISHTKFENLVDSTGAKASIEAQYQVYSAFSYFHTWCNMIPEVYAKDLKKIGDMLINDLSEVESPVNLGSKFLSGSKFMHGIETIEFRGLSIIDDTICAIVGLDERGGGYIMNMKPMPVLKVKTVGGTRYLGDIYIELDSLQVKKVNATVIDITKTTMYGMPVDITVPVTTITIKSVSKNVFDKE